MNRMKPPKKEKTALVIQGGSLRSVFTSGVLDSFMAADFNPFDIFIGVSGGSMCMSYYLANQYKATYEILHTIAADPNFINIRQLFATEGYVNLSYLESFAHNNMPLDLKKVNQMAMKHTIEVVATNMADGEPVYIRPSIEKWFTALRASSTLPFLTRGYCMYEGLRLMDGGWSDPIPVERAVHLGASKIVVIRTLPAFRKLEKSYFGWLGAIWHRDNPALSRRFSEDHVYYNQTIDYIAENPDNVEIVQIAPEKDLATGSYSTSQFKLNLDYRLGLDLGLQFVSEYRRDFEPPIEP